jgi:hypothetical protein
MPSGEWVSKYEKLAFTFCKMGTTGLIVWALTPPVFILIIAIAAVTLSARAVWLGVRRSRCFLRRPTLIIGFWGAVGIADAVWIFVLGQRLPAIPW